MTTIVFSDTILTNPSNAPYLPDLNFGLIASFRASSVTGVSDASAVTSLQFTGQGEAADKLYQNAMSSWPKPLYYANGGYGDGPRIRVADGRRIANISSGVPSVSSPVPQPITRAFRLNISEWQAGVCGIIRVIDGNYLQTIQPSATIGSIVLNAGSAATVAAGIPDDTWTTLIVCFNGADSWLKVGLGVKIAFSAGSHLYNGEVIGGNGSATTQGTYLDFSFDAYDRWHRELSDDEASAWAGAMLS